MSEEPQSYVSHLESALDGTVLPADKPQTTHRGRPLWVRYHLDAIRAAVGPKTISARPPTMWRYRELLLPGGCEPVSLGETMTPLLDCPRLGRAMGLKKLWIKDESRLPTGSFKARGMAMAMTMARHFGLNRVVAPTAGNAGGALAAYAARAGIECHLFMPADTPEVNRYEASRYGARVYLVDGLITDCAKIARESAEKLGLFDMSTLREPYRLEGKKTMGLELAEQLGWRLPDVILYPTGGGTGLIGMFKAFAELHQLGWLADGAGEGRARLFCCQSSGCDPLVRAFESGQRFAEPAKGVNTVAAGLRVPAAVGDFMVLDAVRGSGGRAMAADEERLVEWMMMVWETEGIALCPEAAVCVGVLKEALRLGHIGPEEEVVLFNTAAGQKYVEVIRAELPLLEGAKAAPWQKA